MPKDESAPTVSHTTESSIPFASTGIGPTIHTTEVKTGDSTYTGKGWTEKEANENAGEKVNSGDKD